MTHSGHVQNSSRTLRSYRHCAPPFREKKKSPRTECSFREIILLNGSISEERFISLRSAASTFLPADQRSSCWSTIREIIPGREKMATEEWLANHRAKESDRKANNLIILLMVVEAERRDTTALAVLNMILRSHTLRGTLLP
jgi:hypothetical protein